MMMMMISRYLFLLVACLFVASEAFMAPTKPSVSTFSSTSLGVFGKKKEEEDLSFIETRDMTPEEMQRYNKRSEDIMQGELWGMTIFSLILSIPMLYLVWVGFFSETAELADSAF